MYSIVLQYLWAIITFAAFLQFTRRTMLNTIYCMEIYFFDVSHQKNAV